MKKLMYKVWVLKEGVHSISLFELKSQAILFRDMMITSGVDIAVLDSWIWETIIED